MGVVLKFPRRRNADLGPDFTTDLLRIIRLLKSDTEPSLGEGNG